MWAAVSSKYGIKLAGNATEKYLTRRGVKLTGKELQDAANAVLRRKIAEHAHLRNHFPKKSIDEIETFIKNTMTNGKRVPHPNLPNRIAYVDENTNVILIIDGQGGGTFIRPDNLRNWMKQWTKGIK